jgi:uncharacterized protein YjbI with pentapeptide repeats
MLGGGAVTTTTVTLIGVILTFTVSSASIIFQWSGQRWQRRQLWIADRFTKAIDHLGSSSPQVRVGAVFELERIAKDSPPDRPHIVSTLATLVRQVLPEAQVIGNEYVDVLIIRAPDAQAALTVLCRPPLSDNRPHYGQIGGLDLSRTDLRHARLSNAQLQHANLFASHLEGADLRHANLSDSNLASANFGRLVKSSEFKYGADLRHANPAEALNFADAIGTAEALVDADDGPTAEFAADCKTCGPLPPEHLAIPHVMSVNPQPINLWLRDINLTFCWRLAIKLMTSPWDIRGTEITCCTFASEFTKPWRFNSAQKCGRRPLA